MLMSSRQFNNATGAAKKAASTGPVFITERGAPTHVLLTIDAYKRLAGSLSLADALACPDAADIDLEPVCLGQLCKPADLS